MDRADIASIALLSVGGASLCSGYAYMSYMLRRDSILPGYLPPRHDLEATFPGSPEPHREGIHVRFAQKMPRYTRSQPGGEPFQDGFEPASLPIPIHSMSHQHQVAGNDGASDQAGSSRTRVARHAARPESLTNVTNWPEADSSRTHAALSRSAATPSRAAAAYTPPVVATVPHIRRGRELAAPCLVEFSSGPVDPQIDSPAGGIFQARAGAAETSAGGNHFIQAGSTPYPTSNVRSAATDVVATDAPANAGGFTHADSTPYPVTNLRGGSQAGLPHCRYPSVFDESDEEIDDDPVAAASAKLKASQSSSNIGLGGGANSPIAADIESHESCRVGSSLLGSALQEEVRSNSQAGSSHLGSSPQEPVRNFPYAGPTCERDLGSEAIMNATRVGAEANAFIWRMGQPRTGPFGMSPPQHPPRYPWINPADRQPYKRGIMVLHPDWSSTFLRPPSAGQHGNESTF